MSYTDLRNLPAEVVERLARLEREHGIDARAIGAACVQRGKLLEARAAKVELRLDDPENPVIDGYATVYEYPYEVAGGPPWGWTETIGRGAAAKSVQERDDVRFMRDHDEGPFARTRSKTLELESDDTGLRVRASVDPRSDAVGDMLVAMQRGDLDEMSFAFKATEQTWNEDFTERRITQVRLYDVSVVTYPANPATVAQLRSLNENTGFIVMDDPDCVGVSVTSMGAVVKTYTTERGMSVSLARAIADQARLTA